MKKWLKENWFKLSVLVLITVFGLVTIYWSQIRPSNIRKQCEKLAVDYATEQAPSWADEGSYEINDYETAYRVCLRQKGIKE